MRNGLFRTFLFLPAFLFAAALAWSALVAGQDSSSHWTSSQAAQTAPHGSASLTVLLNAAQLGLADLQSDDHEFPHPTLSPARVAVQLANPRDGVALAWPLRAPDELLRPPTRLHRA